MNSVQRRYLLTIAALAAATVAIILFTTLRSTNRINYELPKLANVERTEVDEIVIERPNTTVTLSQSGSDWIVQPGNYSADMQAVRFIRDTLIELKITDVISARSDPAYFDLDEENRVRVTLAGSGEELRVVDIGRRAATLGHTFVGVPGDNRILQAIGELRGIFDRDVDAFRDKRVFSFDPLSVNEISMIKTVPPLLPEQVNVVRTDSGWGPSGQTDGGPLDSDGIDDVLRFLGSLSAYRYRYTDETLSEPWLQVRMIGDETYTLSIFRQDGNVFPAKTSHSSYAFDMFLFQASLVTDSFGLDRLDE